ncbi:hypothetical protein KKH82_05990 [Patescibacteria group bacterium]|nr:hypothetical protein [Patescibacteria group bacterium]
MKKYTFTEKLKVCWYILRGKCGVPKKYRFSYSSDIKMHGEEGYKTIKGEFCADILGNVITEKVELFTPFGNYAGAPKCFQGSITNLNVYEGDIGDLKIRCIHN